MKQVHLTRGLLGCSLSLLAAPALAQTTGTQDFDDIVVTGKAADANVGGVTLPATAKAKVGLDSSFIQHETPGQTINDTLNMLPGVSFQNNDPYGSAGGTISIRGFDGSRVSQMWDGFPLNDTGNYAIYSNQQLDPELIGQATVSLGSTDVDSPSASATGSTINYQTRNPSEDFHVRVAGSVGDYDFMRIFGVVDTGVITPFGTRLLLSGSKSTNDVVFTDKGKIDKTQFNAKVYQPIGSNGDFISIAGHYNRNINNFFGSVPLSTVGGSVGTGSGNRFPLTRAERFYDVADCVSSAGVACGFGAYDYRYNPSKTANVRVNSRFTLADRLVLTVDAAYAYTLANGGGTATANEGFATIGGQRVAGYVGSTPYFGGVDLNGDGDTNDTVLVSAPSTTHTDRYLLNLGLRYDFNPFQTVRIGYSLDYGRHRQTGELTTINGYGLASTPFPSEAPLLDSTGTALQKRDRLSKAILNQAFGEYRGRFLDSRLTLTAGVRAPFFTRDLTNYCFTTSASGALICSGRNAATDAIIAAAYPTYQGPQNRLFHYSRVLPSAGLVYQLTAPLAFFANYSKGMQVPGTDNLYNSFYYAQGTSGAEGAKPETTDNLDAGLRYQAGRVQAQLSGWYTVFHDRLASSYDLETNTTIYRNLGTVHKYGVDGSVSYRPVRALTLYAFGSYLKSKILNDVQASATTTYLTAGKREAGAPTYTFGGRVEGHAGPVRLGIEAKRTGERYVNDQNLPVVIGGVQVYGAKAPAYTLVNLDARFSLEPLGLNDQTYLQLNVSNLFDTLYVGGFSGTTSTASLTYAQIGAPRAVSATLTMGF
ncbi:TonB-dependent receptor [Sphingomonas kyungheensis]|uniref:TonB-dependent receptor n=1 Tax=Sphingomonas kyungheensis TaxID=1069987 RepID=A0ABU8H689_9SPHN